MSSTYSHSWHWNQSVSVHWSASSWLMWSSSLHPQHDTSTVLLSLMNCSLNSVRIVSMFSLFILFISLFFLSLTEDSLTENPVDCKLYFHLFSYFLCDYLNAVGTDHASWQAHPHPLRPPVFSEKSTCHLLFSVGGALFSISPTFLIHFNLSTKEKKNRTQLNPMQNTQVGSRKERGEIFT